MAVKKILPSDLISDERLLTYLTAFVLRLSGYGFEMCTKGKLIYLTSLPSIDRALILCRISLQKNKGNSTFAQLSDVDIV